MFLGTIIHPNSKSGSRSFQVREVLIAMKADAGNIEVIVGGEFLLRVDGGATVNNLLMQLQVSS